MPNITFVDDADNVIGYGSKVEALSKGLIHRIVRVYVTNKDGDILIQKRSATVDVPNRWDCSASGHVDEGEDYDTAAYRELQEEVGVTNVSLKKIASYSSEESDDGVLRRRRNNLYTVQYDSSLQKDAAEVEEAKWVSPDTLYTWMQDTPEDFTQGFLESYRQYRQAA